MSLPVGISVRFTSESGRVFEFPGAEEIRLVRSYAASVAPTGVDTEFIIIVPRGEAPSQGDSGMLSFSEPLRCIEERAVVAKAAPWPGGVGVELLKVEFAFTKSPEKS